MTPKELADANERQLEKIGQMIFDIVRLAGGQLHTAYVVAGLFVQGIANEWKKDVTP